MKLSYGQLWAVLFLFRAFTFICSGDAFSVQRAGGEVLSVFIQLLAVIPVVRYCRENDVSSESIRKGGIVFALYFISAGMMVFARMFDMTGTENFAVSGNIICAVLLAATAAYCSHLGIHAAGRSAVIISGLFMFFLALLLLTTASGIRADNLNAEYDDITVPQYVLRDLAQSTELPAVMILSLFTERKQEKAVYIFLGTKLAVTAAVTVLGAAVCGRVSVISNHPFFELCSFSDALGVQRSDALFVAACTLMAVVYLAVSLIMASRFLNRYFNRYAPAAALVCMASGGYLMRGGRADDIGLIFVLISAVSVIICTVSLRKSERRRKAECI